MGCGIEIHAHIFFVSVPLKKSKMADILRVNSEQEEEGPPL